MTKRKTNGAKKALSMSEQNAAAIQGVHDALDQHTDDELKIWGTVQAQISDLHGAWFGDPKQPDRKGYAEQIRDSQDAIGELKTTVGKQGEKIDGIVKEARWTGGVGGAISVVAAAVVAAFVGPRQ